VASDASVEETNEQTRQERNDAQDIKNIGMDNEEDAGDSEKKRRQDHKSDMAAAVLGAAALFGQCMRLSFHDCRRFL